MAVDTQIGKMMARQDPLMTFQWVVAAMPMVDGADLTPEYVEAIEIPFNNIKVEGVFRGGGYNYYPGFHDVSAFNVTFYADVQNRSINYIMAWKRMVKDFSTGLYNLPPEYKRNWTVYLLNPMGERVFEVELQGTWPADTGQLNLNYEESGRVTFQQNFSIDNAVIKV